MFLIIGGTAAYFLDIDAIFGTLEWIQLHTPYGKAFPIGIVRDSPVPLAFASRHGRERLEMTPPFVNARANIWAAHTLGVCGMFSWNGVGAMNPLLELHDMLIINGLLDFTKTRPRRFEHHNPNDHVHHLTTHDTVAFPPASHLFDTTLTQALAQVAHNHTARIFPRGVYACSEGPRLETAAEIASYRRMGGDVVGMTLVPEVYLAHEKHIPFASVAYVTNYATGIEPMHDAPRHFGVDVAHTCLAVIRDAIALLASTTMTTADSHTTSFHTP